MGIVTELALPEAEKRLLNPQRKIRLSVPAGIPHGARAIALGLGSLVVAFAPDFWQRCVAFLLVGLLLYGVGYWDGRRDLALETLRRNERPSRPIARGRPDAEGG